MKLVRSTSEESGSNENGRLLNQEKNLDQDLAQVTCDGYQSVRNSSICDRTSQGQTYTMQEAIDRYGFGRFQYQMSFLLGLCYMADSMEYMLLSILAPALRCIWSLTGSQEATLTTVSYVGMFLTAGAWGILFDKYGRKRVLTYFLFITGYFGSLSALSPNYLWLLFLRFVVGLCIGATPQCITYYVEFLPTKVRGQCIMAIAIFWAFGAMLLILVALVTIPALGWRGTILINTLPMVVVLLLNGFLSESPRFCIAHGDMTQAVNILAKIAKANGKEMLPGALYDPLLKKKEKSRLRDIFHPAYLKTTILVSIIWVCGMVSYFGTTLLSATMFTVTDGCHGYDSSASTTTTTNSNTINGCSVRCKSLDEQDYKDLLFTTLGDVPGVLLSIVMMAKVKRRTAFIAMFLCYAGLMLACNVCMERKPLVVLFLIARALVNGLSQFTLVYSSEVYPTSVRAAGIAFGSTCHKAVSLFIPFVTQALIRVSVYIPISFFAGLGLLGAVASFLLPIETKDREILDVVNEEDGKRKA